MASKNSVQGLVGCPLLSTVMPIDRALAEYGPGTITFKAEVESLYEETKRLKIEAHQTNLDRFIEKVKDLKLRGAFGLVGGEEMLQRFEVIGKGNPHVDLSNSATVDPILQAMIPVLTDSKCHIQFLK